MVVTVVMLLSLRESFFCDGATRASHFLFSNLVDSTILLPPESPHSQARCLSFHIIWDRLKSPHMQGAYVHISIAKEKKKCKYCATNSISYLMFDVGHLNLMLKWHLLEPVHRNEKALLWNYLSIN